MAKKSKKRSRARAKKLGSGIKVMPFVPSEQEIRDQIANGQPVGIGAEKQTTLPFLPQGSPSMELPKDPGLRPGITEEDVKRAQEYAERFETEDREYSEAGSQGPSVGIEGASRKGKSKRKQALIDFYQQKKGMSAEEAEKKANKVQKPGGKKPSDVKGFSNFIAQQGDEYGLSLGKDGKIKASLDPVTYSETTPGIRDNITDLQEKSTGYAGNLLDMEYGDIADSIGFRGGIRDTLRNTLAAQGVEGFTKEQKDALAAQREAALTDYSDTFNANVGNVLNRLNTGGALRSSLLGENLRQGAFKGYGQFLQGLQGQLADQGQKYLNDAATRQRMRIGNLTGALRAAGTGSASQMYNPFMSPSSFGLATDPQQAQIMLQKEALDQRGRQFAAGQRMDALTQPYLQPNSAPAFGGGGLAGAAAGAGLGFFM